MSWPCGPPPRMKGYAFDHTGASPDNRGPRRGMAVHLMVETTPLGKWSGRRRTNLRLVLSSPRDKLDTRRRLLFERGAMLEVKVENCAGIDAGKKFLAVCVLTGPVDRKPAAEVRRFGTSVKELERLRAWLVERKCTEAVMESTGSYWKPVFNILRSEERRVGKEC